MLRIKGFEFDPRTGRVTIESIEVGAGEAEPVPDGTPLAPAEPGPGAEEVYELGYDPFNAPSHCEHDIEAVSRHTLAEQDLFCPRCKQHVAHRGDFSQVRRYRYPGPGGEPVINEAVRCVNEHIRNGTKETCNCLLFASPDTEHGDQTLEVPFADLTKFKRIGRDEAVKEQYDQDISERGDIGGGSFLSQNPFELTPITPKE